uniref:Sodium-and chloride-dependent glycine transporter 2 n=1 Tax=Bursaphelenchus xylophilus TaxID=6326 RepID=A0A1I7S6B2_BURXY
MGTSQSKDGSTRTAIPTDANQQPEEVKSLIGKVPSARLNLDSADEEIRRIVKSRFQKQDWAMGRGVVEEEMLVMGFRPKSLVSHEVKHDFEIALEHPSSRPKSARPNRMISNIIYCITYSLSCSVILDFPYLCYKHGGATFLIHWLISLILFGIPMVFIEIGLGQYYGKSVTLIFAAMNPSFTGIGMAMLMINVLKSLWNLKVVVISVYMFTFGLQSWYKSENQWSRCPDISVNCFDFIKQERCTHLKEMAIEGLVGQQEYEREKCPLFLESLGNTNFSGAHGVNPIMMDFMNAYVWPIPPDLNRFEYGSEPIIQITMGTFTLAMICMGIGMKTIGLIPLGMLKIMAVMVLPWLYYFFSSAPNIDAGWRMFFTFQSTHLFDGQSWADAIYMVMTTMSICDGTLHRVGALYNFSHRYWTSVFSLVIVTVFSCVMSTLTLTLAVSLLAHQMYTHGGSANGTDLRIHEYMVHGQSLTWSAVPEALNAFGLVGPFHLIVAYYFSIAAIAFSSLVMNLSQIFCCLKESALFGFLLSLGKPLITLKKLLLFLMLTVFFLPLVFTLTMPWSIVLVRLGVQHSANVMFLVALLEAGVVAYCYNGGKFFVDIRTMHTRLSFITAVPFICILTISPLLAYGGFSCQLSLNQMSRVADYVIPTKLRNAGYMTLIAAIFIIYMFPTVSILTNWFNHYSIKAAWQIQPTWVPQRKHDAKVAHANRLAFRSQQSYSRCVVAKKGVRHVTEK